MEAPVRRGRTVRCPVRPNTAFVLRVLRHLEATGARWAPRALGIDEHGLEVLSWIPRETPGSGDRVDVLALARIVPDLHDLTVDLVEGSECVIHDDLQSRNIFVQGRRPIGLIDWEQARPDRRVEDGHGVTRLRTGKDRWMIQTADHDGIAILTLNHGPVNALDLELLTAVPEALAAVADARAVVLTGSGKSFSAGVDLKQIVDGGPRYVERFLPALSLATLTLFEHPTPVVAAVNGHALAGGCVLAAACDIRLMSSGTIGLTELAAGVPFPTVALEIMRHAVGSALDAMVLGADRLTPAQATRTDLVHEVVEPDQLLAAALRRAEGLCAAPPDVYAFSKHQLHRPARERIGTARPSDDPDVLTLWSSDRTSQALRNYLASLRRGR